MKIVTQFRIALGSLAACAGANAYAAFFIPNSTAFQVAASFLGMGVMIYLWVMTYTRLERPFVEMGHCSEKVGSGDLSTRVCYAADDELGIMARNFGRMLEALNSMIATIMAASNRIVATVDVLRERADRTVSSARDQNGRSQQIAAAAEEMNQTIMDIAKNATSSSDTSSSALESARRGNEVAERSQATVQRVSEATATLSRMIEKLNGRVDEISDIATVIKGIADQTNLLALNAAIEAARAGEQGRGFAVVADEVRKLAERTITATGDISAKISAVQAESQETMSSMEHAAGEVIQATEEIKNVGASLASIVASVQTSRDQITRIAASVEQQSSTTGEVASNIEQTASIARDMERMAGEVSHDVSNLIGIVEEIRTAAATFTITGNELLIIDRAKSDHLLFLNKVRSHLNNGAKLEADKLPDHHSCRFGKWYDTEARTHCGGSSAYRAVEQPHARFHALAKEAVSARSSGDSARADRMYAEMKGFSAQILRQLDAMKAECAAAGN